MKKSVMQYTHSCIHALNHTPDLMLSDRTTENIAWRQTMQDKLSESPQCNDMVANLHFPWFFDTTIQCEIARHFPGSVVKVGLNFKAKISLF